MIVDTKVYRAMQSLYANSMDKAKTLSLSCDSGSLDVNVEEKWRVQLSQNF